MENKKFDLKKSLICTLLIAFAISAMATSAACARETAPSQTSPNDTVITSDDNPVLIAPPADTAIGSNDTNAPLSDRSQDNSTASADDSTLYDSANSESNNPNLIATQAQPDYLAIIVVLVACVAAIASVAIFVSRRQTKNSK
jgi:hypothetical protein